jgi:4-amino-4-deoxy-L-arabinose transferase-like glycosyltransferase
MTTGKRRLNFLILAVLLGLVTRLAYVATVGRGACWTDELDYEAIAKNLALGKGYSMFRDYNSTACGPTAYRLPVLPAVMAVFYRLFGETLFPTRVLQAFLGALMVLLAYAISTNLGYSMRAALLAATGVALYPYYIYCAGAVYPVTLACVILGLSVLFLLKGCSSDKLAWEMLAGLSLGIATLAFGHVIASVPFIAAWVLLSKTTNRWRAATVLLVSCAAVLTPWVVRNALMLGSPVISTASSFNFLVGNHPTTAWNSGNRASAIVLSETARKTARMREAEAARFYSKMAVQYIRADMGRFVRLSIAKAVNFWRFYPNPTSRRVGTLERAVGLLTCGPILVAGFFWFAYDREHRMRNWLLILFPLSWMMVAATTISIDRHRLPADQFFVVWAAAALDRLLATRRDVSGSGLT